MQTVLSETEYAILELLKEILFGSTEKNREKDSSCFFASGGIDPVEMYRKMAVHGTASLAGDMIKYLPMDDGVRNAWKRHCINQQIHYQRLIQTQTELCTAFRETGIDYVILKGTAVAMYYPVPQQRSLGDIDMLIKKDDVQKAEKVLWGLRFNRIMGIDERHLKYNRGGIDLELHMKFALEKDPSKEVFLENYLMEGFAERGIVSSGGTEFSVLPAAQNGMVILQHIPHHLYVETNLRMITDWMMFVHSSGLRDWSEFNQVSQKAGLFTLQKTLTGMCVRYLGLPEREDISWCADAGEDVIELLLEHIFNKNDSKNKSIDLGGKFAVAGSLPGALRMLQNSGLSSWEAARKYPVLRPFAWLHRSAEISRDILRRGDLTAGLKADVSRAKDIGELLEKLGLEKRY